MMVVIVIVRYVPKFNCIHEFTIVLASLPYAFNMNLICT